MAKKNVIDKVEGAKVWGYIAMGAAILAGAAIVITVKESMDAKKAAKNLALAQAELESVKNGETPQEEIAENFSGCSGCSSNVVGRSYPLPMTAKTNYKTYMASGKSNVVGRDYPLQRGLVSNWRL